MDADPDPEKAVILLRGWVRQVLISKQLWITYN